jgi:16S rRNA (uracil1498-N3)-methyltransferase
MSNPVFFVRPESLTSSVCRIDGDEGRHAAAVKRLRVGEPVDVCDGRGSRGTGTVLAVTKDTVDVRVLRVVTEPADPVRFVVVQALAKGDRADMAIEVLTELGVSDIVPWGAQYSVAKWDDDKTQAKWQRIAREASKKSRRSRIPTVHGVVTTSQVARMVAEAQMALVLHESARASLADVPVPQRGEVLVIVGPEGGLAPGEVEMFEAAGGRVVRMGSTVMRTSTAGAAALAVLASRTAAWGARMQQ